jgi:hypothetical protein
MNVVVEDGTGIFGANAYIGVDELSNYFDNVRLEKWNALDTDTKEAAVLQSSLFIDATFKWIGQRVKGLDQGLSWPRVNAKFEGQELTGVPIPVKKAAAEAVWAFINLTEGQSLFPSVQTAQVHQETFGPMSTSYFEKRLSDEQPTSYAVINGLLKGLYAPVYTGGVAIADVKRD